MIAFSLCGLWHGPAWHFAAWGLFHGLGLSLSVVYGRIPVVGALIGKAFAKEPLVRRSVITQALYACIGWLLFFYPVSVAFHMLEAPLRPMSETDPCRDHDRKVGEFSARGRSSSALPPAWRSARR